MSCIHRCLRKSVGGPCSGVFTCVQRTKFARLGRTREHHTNTHTHMPWRTAEKGVTTFTTYKIQIPAKNSRISNRTSQPKHSQRSASVRSVSFSECRLGTVQYSTVYVPAERATLFSVCVIDSVPVRANEEHTFNELQRTHTRTRIITSANRSSRIYVTTTQPNGYGFTYILPAPV